MEAIDTRLHLLMKSERELKNFANTENYTVEARLESLNSFFKSYEYQLRKAIEENVKIPVC